MNIETRVYKLLIASDIPNLLNSIRGSVIPEENGIWKHDIPETFRKKELAPFIRINPVYEGDYDYSDDSAMSEEQRVQISYWCKTDTQAYQIKQMLDDVLKSNDFTNYTANETPRYKDTDIDLLINHRKYRFFDWES